MQQLCGLTHWSSHCFVCSEWAQVVGPKNVPDPSVRLVSGYHLLPWYASNKTINFWYEILIVTFPVIVATPGLGRQSLVLRTTRKKGLLLCILSLMPLSSSSQKRDVILKIIHRPTSSITSYYFAPICQHTQNVNTKAAIGFDPQTLPSCQLDKDSS